MSNKKNKNNPFNKIILILMLLSSLFSGYLHTSIPVFFFALIILGIYLFQIKFTVSQILAICIFFIYLIVILINSTEVLSSLSNLKWFYGILVFLINFLFPSNRIFKNFTSFTLPPRSRSLTYLRSPSNNKIAQEKLYTQGHKFFFIFTISNPKSLRLPLILDSGFFFSSSFLFNYRTSVSYFLNCLT